MEESKGDTEPNDDGWNYEDPNKKYEKQLIQLAIVKNPLSKVLKDNKIYFDSTFASNGWTQKRSCPFPDHNDNSPSFYYNSELDLFNCFGCGRSGKSVHFLAYLTGKTFSQVAKDLTKDGYVDSAETYIEVIDSSKEIQKIMFEFAEQISSTDQNKADKLSLIFDTFVQNAISESNLNVETIKVISKFLLNKING